ncbi:MAG: cupredoxin domain-containing protein, partial [Solirubrobacterales bacterium]
VATATAAEQVVAGPAPTTYLNPNVAIDSGEALTFFNLDLTAPHDVTSTEVGPGAEPLFRSETVGAFVEVPVVGAERLSPGSYPYLCSIHTFMEGTLTVLGAGSGDNKAPKLTLRARDGKVGKVVKAGELRLRAKVSEPAELRLTVKAAGGKGKVAAATTQLERGGNRVVAELTSKGERILRGSDRIELKVKGRAEDAAGNASRSRETLELR